MIQKEKQPAAARALPAALASVALIDAKTCAAAGDMSVTWWHDAVRAGRAPAPAIRRPRCTRWRVSEVHEFWRAFVDVDSVEIGARMTANATRASGIAQAKRRAEATEV